MERSTVSLRDAEIYEYFDNLTSAGDDEPAAEA
jgi:hypothetical protein